MARIRKIEISNFRGIKSFSWLPSSGLNCLIGPGDSGKSSVLDAIDFCLGARRNLQITDADFHKLDVETPIRISVTIGELEDGLKTFDTYGLYLRGFETKTGIVKDEPEKDSETVLTVDFMVTGDLEPSWSLISDRAKALGQTRSLSWGDRVRLAPTRIDAGAAYHLGWRRGSVLNRVSDERVDASAALVKAARDVRAAFGERAKEQLGKTLEIVESITKELGVPVGNTVKALLDAHSASFNGGTISLHDECGVPLWGLGIGSTRLLVAGLQRKASEQAKIILIDELEHGLEPHRIQRFLGSLGAKEKHPPLQVFMTTHSPVALRELSGNQLFVMRPASDKHEARNIGDSDDIQSTIRLYPEAFLAPSVIICEGASEVGLLRGLDQYFSRKGFNSISARGVSLVDCGGGEADKPFKRAAAFISLGYRTAILRDGDQKPDVAMAKAFTDKKGKVVEWREGRALEDELFLSLGDAAIDQLINRAIELHGEDLVNDHIKSVSKSTKTLDSIRDDSILDTFSVENRTILGKAARTKKAGWFKSISWLEDVARDIVGPDLEKIDPSFKAAIDEIFAWANNAGR